VSDLVHILHAAPLVHLPPRARDVRTSYAPCTTSVRLPELSRRETEAGPMVPVVGTQPLSTLLVGGEIWRPIGCSDAFAPGATGPSAPDFRSWLAGDPAMAVLDTGDVARCLEGTPLLARAPAQRTPPRPYGPWNEAKVGRIVHELREEAGTAVERFVAGDLALVDGKPFMRFPGPLAYHDAGMGTTRIVRHPGAWTTNSSVSAGIPFRIDRTDEMARFLGKSSAAKIGVAWDPAAFAGIDLGRDDDTDLFVRDALRQFRAYLGDRVSGPGPYDGSRLDALLRLSARGSAGMIGAGMHGEACELVLALSNDVLDGPTTGWIRDAAVRSRKYALEHALPRIAEASDALTGDLDSLGALAR
jgi:hypothetical protein